MLTSHWVSIEKTLSYIKTIWKLRKKSVMGWRRRSVWKSRYWLAVTGLQWKIEVSGRGGEARTYHNIGNIYFPIEQFKNAVNNFVSQVAAVTRYNVIASIPIPKQKGKTTTIIVLSIGIVAASIVLNDDSQYLLFSLLFWVWLSSQSHCILRELQHYWATTSIRQCKSLHGSDEN